MAAAIPVAGALPKLLLAISVGGLGPGVVAERLLWSDGIRPHLSAASITSALRHGAEFRDCAKDCPEMIIVLPGSFTMGSPATERGRNDNEGQHHVTIASPFAVSKFDVTFADWDACVAGKGCVPVSDGGMGRGSKPVVNVSWDEAWEYAAWLSQLTGASYRLLTEAEWEYAARAGSSTAYPWGDEIGKGHANCNGCGSPWDTDQTSPVGSFRPNAFGLYDMHGNVWQWVADCYLDGHAGAPIDASNRTTDACNHRVVRGGSWISVPRYLRSAYRFGLATGYRFDDVGFRVARTLLLASRTVGDDELGWSP
jgi:formylglycine-generating enzyme required for sulfatase activity